MPEPIAVVGLAGRFPAAPDLTEFWRNLADGRDCLTDLDDEDLLRRGELPEYLSHPDYVRRRPCLPDADMFDARCFRMTPREAEIRDPQQRVLLEVAHSALEHAGYDPARYPGAIGVFAGTNLNRYRIDHLEPSAAGRQGVSFLALEISNAPDYVATFIAHRLGLRGPSTTVQTACSTALTAIHTACLSLRAGDCDMALAGAASIEMPLDYGYVHLDGNILARDGTPRPFDADADGTNFGSGAGVIVLKRLGDAIADRDTIIAVVRGSALNNDGDRKSSFTMPSVVGQAECVAEAIRSAGVDPREISYVETHGTGTKAGDPIEVLGLTEGFRQAAGGPLPNGYCPIGSVKSNVGHMGQAAGACGFIKTALSLAHELIPASINVSTVNPLLRLEETPFVVGTQAQPWPRTPGRPRRAGVSSFGIGGTNGHVVLEESPEPIREPGPVRDAELVVWSAAEPEAVDDLQSSLAGYLADVADAQTFRDAAYTLRVGRRERRHRAAVVARDAAEAARLLRDGGTVIRSDGQRRDLVFCFPGQAAQYPGMGHRLYDTEPAFRRHCDEAFALLRPHLDDDLRARWRAATEPAELAATEVAQPLLFVVEYALARTLAQWGLRPARVIGHSVGELVAATVAGVFDLPDGLRAVAARSQLMQEMPEGGMLAVAAGEERVRRYLTQTVGLAAVNGERQTVLAGSAGELAEVAGRLRADGVGSNPLPTSHAFHSAMMAPAAKGFEAVLGELPLHRPEIPLVSCATGAPLTDDEAVTPSFWAAQLVEPTYFATALRSVVETAPATLVEIGPGRTLGALARGAAEVRSTGSVTLATLGTDGGDGATLERTLGRLWVQGYPLDLLVRDEESTAHRVPAPGYPYRRRRFWVERPPDHQPPRDNALILGGAPRSAPAISASAAAAPAEIASPTVSETATTTDPPPAPGAAPVGWSLATMRWVCRNDGRAPVPDHQVAGAAAALVLPPHADLAAEVRTAFQLAGFRTVRATLVAADPPASPAAASRAAGSPAPASPAAVDEAAAAAPPTTAGATLDPGLDRDWDVLLERAVEAGSPAVLAFAGLLSAPAAVDLPTLDDQLERGYFSVLAAARATARAQRRHRTPVSLLVLTRHAVDVTGAETVNPATAMIPALLRTVEQEYPGVRCVALDVAPGTPQDVLAAALAEPAGPLVALRGTATWTPVLHRPLQSARPGRPRLRQHGVYLVTGGLGGIGLAVARALADTGRQPRIALLGRSGVPAAGDPGDGAIAAALAELADAGAEAMVVSADVSDPVALDAAVERIQERFGPINGVVHSAGVPGGGLLDTRSRVDTERVFAAKLRGTLALEHSLASRPPLDFLVLCSSQAALGGMLGSGDYAAANAFLNAHAQRHGRGARWTMSIAWPAWSEVGMWAATHRPVAEAGTPGAGGPATPASQQPAGDLEYRRMFDKNEHWELDEHRFAGAALLPATSALELVVTAARQLALLPGTAPLELRDTVFVAPVSGAVPVETRVTFTPVAESFRFAVHSRPARTGEPWVHHVNGTLVRGGQRPEPADLAALWGRFESMPPVPLAGRIQFGPRWQTLTRMGRADGESLAELVLPGHLQDDIADHPMHAALLDRASLALMSLTLDGQGGQYLPFLYRRLTLFAPLSAHVVAHGRVAATPPKMQVLDLDIYDATSGEPLVTIGGLTIRETVPDDFTKQLSPAAHATTAPAGPRQPAGPSHPRAQAPREPEEDGPPLLSPRDGAAAFLELLDGGYPPVVAVQPPDGRLDIPGLPWERAEPATPAPTVVASSAGAPGGGAPGGTVAGAAARVDAAPPIAPVAPGVSEPVAPVATGEEVAAVLRELWADALGIDDLQLDDDFFELGGDSLVAVQLSARVRLRFGVELGAAALFESSTIRSLAEEITAMRAG